MRDEDREPGEQPADPLTDGRLVDPLTRRQFVARLAALGFSATAIAAALEACRSSAREQPEPVPPIALPGRNDPMEHVHRPTRLTLLSPSTAISGIVRHASENPRDGDLKFLVEPDPAYTSLLTEKNEGLFIVEIIPIDRPTVYAPQVGEHATFHGALVLDKAHQSWAEIHPCWLITTPEVQGFLESRPHLQLTVEAPESVRVGDELPVTITVHSLRDGRARPVSRALLFLELVSPKGIVVRWEADYTSPLGTASTHLASLEVAGNYTIHIYASKGRGVGHATHAFRIKRR